MPKQTEGVAQRISIKKSPMSFRSKTGVEVESRKPRKLLIAQGLLIVILDVTVPSPARATPIGELAAAVTP